MIWVHWALLLHSLKLVEQTGSLLNYSISVLALNRVFNVSIHARVMNQWSFHIGIIRNYQLLAMCAIITTDMDRNASTIFYIFIVSFLAVTVDIVDTIEALFVIIIVISIWWTFKITWPVPILPVMVVLRHWRVIHTVLVARFVAWQGSSRNLTICIVRRRAGAWMKGWCLILLIVSGHGETSCLSPSSQLELISGGCDFDSAAIACDYCKAVSTTRIALGRLLLSSESSRSGVVFTVTSIPCVLINLVLWVCFVQH